MSLFQELKRRNVFRVAVAYVIVGWLMMQVAETLSPALRLPDWFTSVVAAFLIVGFPVALVFAWAFELTPEGLKKEKDVDRSESITHATGRKLDFAIIALLGIAVVYLVIDKFSVPADAPTRVAASSEIISTPISAASIAVLPFQNMSDDASNEYFADGITEELLNLLAKIPELHVTSRSSAFAFKGQAINIPQVAAQLNVAHVLEGSVRKAGNTVRITAQLIKADEDRHLWSETYDRQLDDVFAIQDEIAGTVVEQLELTLLGRVPAAAVTDADVYDKYLEGLHFLDVDQPETFSLAQQAFESVVESDPGYAPAWYGLSRAIWEQANIEALPLHEGARLAREAVEKAIKIDPSFAEARAKLAYLRLGYDWDWRAAVETVEKALALGGSSAYVKQVASNVYSTLGDYERAVEYSNAALSIDPLSRAQLRATALTYYYTGDLENAIRMGRKGLQIHPGDVQIYSNLAIFLAMSGQTDEAMDLLPPGEPFFPQSFAEIFVYYAAGDVDAAERSFAATQAEIGDALAYQYAMANAYMGKIDEAFHWLEKSYDRRDGGLTYLLCDPTMVVLYDDPRWEALLRKMNLLEYWIAMPRRLAPL